MPIVRRTYLIGPVEETIMLRRSKRYDDKPKNSYLEARLTKTEASNKCVWTTGRLTAVDWSCFIRFEFIVLCLLRMKNSSK